MNLATAVSRLNDALIDTDHVLSVLLATVLLPANSDKLDPRFLEAAKVWNEQHNRIRKRWEPLMTQLREVDV